MKQESRPAASNKARKPAREPLVCAMLAGVVIALGGYGCATHQGDLHGVTAPAAEPAPYEQADNSFCYVCHLNFQEEPFATWHQNVNVGCVDCHGDSDGHSADESHVIPPDTMYKKTDITDSCMTCHSKTKLEERADHRPFFTASPPKGEYCTDCHGKHSIPERHRVWDKDTGKLLSADGNKVE